MPNRQHVDMYQGEDRTLTLSGRDASNNAVNLASKTIQWSLGRPPLYPHDPAPLVSKTGTATVTASGVFTVSLDADDTRYLDGDYEHIARTTDGSGNIAVILQGRFRVRATLTPTT